jgi:hypothetical protein
VLAKEVNSSSGQGVRASMDRTGTADGEKNPVSDRGYTWAICAFLTSRGGRGGSAREDRGRGRTYQIESLGAVSRSDLCWSEAWKARRAMQGESAVGEDWMSTILRQLP